MREAISLFDLESLELFLCNVKCLIYGADLIGLFYDFELCETGMSAVLIDNVMTGTIQHDV